MGDGFGRFLFFLVCVAFAFYVHMAHQAVQKKKAFLDTAYEQGAVSLKEYMDSRERLSVFDMLFYPNEVLQLK